MATSQHYSLRWNNYLRHITFAFDNLRTQDDFVDVTLCCDGRRIKAHKVLLSACSGYFKDIFKENPHPHPVIIFKFIKYEDLNAIIEFMYQGEVNVQQDALQSFLQTAELLAVQGLTSEEKEKPKSLKTQILEQDTVEKHNLKTIPNTVNTVTEIAQHSPVEIQANITNIVKKRKIIFSDGQENVYNETGDYCKDESTFVKDIQFVPPTVKIDIPEYIDVQNDVEYGETNAMKKQTSPENTTQTTTQFTSEYEILTESEINEKFQTRGSEEISEISSVQIGPLFTTQPTSENGPDNTKSICQDSASSKWTECQFCKMVITTVNLWRHIRTQHTPQPPRKCEICNKNFKNKYSLREHIRISHEHKQNI